MLEVLRLAQDIAHAFGDGVAANDDGGARIAVHDAFGDVGGFLIGQASDEFWRRFSAADSALGQRIGLDDFKFIAMFSHQFPSPRGTAG